MPTPGSSPDVPPVLDIYVWIDAQPLPAVLEAFIVRHVGLEQPAEHRFGAFRRTFVEGDSNDGDRQLLSELARDGSEPHPPLTIYLEARNHYRAMITVTRERRPVLGLSIDDPENSPDTIVRARRLMDELMHEFGATAGIAGVELAPPESAAEWNEDDFVQLRVGHVPGYR